MKNVSPETSQLLVLGLDPGSRSTGYGLIKEQNGRLTLIKAGTIRPQTKKNLSLRLADIFSKLTQIIQDYQPQEAAVEDVFVAHNTSSALKLGQARGAALVACSVNHLQVATYEPTLIKKTLVGNGRADKRQVAFMVGKILGVEPNWPQDSSDALAVGICHFNMKTYQYLRSRN